MASELIEAETDLAYEEEGSGPAVVLLHGFPFNHTLWQPQLEALKSNHRVIVPDLRGHGDSEVTIGTVTMEMMAEDIAALMDRLDIESAAIGGLSMGGYVALAFVREFPERVTSLVLADTRAQNDSEEARKNRLIQVEKALNEGMAPIAEAMLPKLLTQQTIINRVDIVNHVRDMIMTTPAEGAAAALRGMAQRHDQRSFLGQINVPTLIIVGREDPITPLQDSELMHERIGGSRLEIIDGAAHVSNLEQPESFNEALLSFL